MGTVRDDDAFVRETVDNHLELHGSRHGNPAKGPETIINRAVSGRGPMRQILGSDSHACATAKVQALQANLDATAETAPTTGFPATT
ncbi:hypothetical protein OH738_38740 [Streptomyces hirsutus]|uniref:Uncharacterized protein n=1 Tax=Streptomyces hirsutus TaxID=35620 RepID=A0ABZ1GGE8_9ACTN|nr:hypothetical protein [Streptomyces hirsutus]WSD04518.1 hypothetical protein OIE73_01205 [Streptomyces hirsutus]WTD22092.1 hypothetical protein OH738_38740 [Streptomyces hirsutus]WTD79472.1 hypothetical protein OHB56_40120 [Streptomyces sp. NBC_01635]